MLPEAGILIIAKYDSMRKENPKLALSFKAWLSKGEANTIKY